MPRTICRSGGQVPNNHDALRLELDGGPGDRHTIIVASDGTWHGVENLFTHLPRYARGHAVSCLLTAANRGAAKYDVYEITDTTVVG